MDFSFLSSSLKENLLNIFFISISSLGVVYMFGRMLFLNLSARQKNIIAIICLFFFSFIYQIGQYAQEVSSEEFLKILLNDKIALTNIVINGFFYFFTSIVIYVLFAFRLYSRVDFLLDQKIGKDCTPDDVKEMEKRKKK